MSYGGPERGLPPQSALMTGRAVFTEAYAVIPRGVQRDIVTSAFPGWQGARGWVLARPMSGFSETFSHIVMEVAPGGGSDAPEPDPAAECVIFVTRGEVRLSLAARPRGFGFQAGDGHAGTPPAADGAGEVHALGPGGYAYVPAGLAWTLVAGGDAPAEFHWVRKAYEAVENLPAPEPFVANERDIAPSPMPGTDRWMTTRFAAPDDLRHDMHVNIVTLEPGGVIPFEETHVMEHGLYVIEGKAAYKLNRDWVEVEAGDFLWLRAFCPQACYAAGPGRFRYLLYKDVNRLPRLGGPWR